MQIDIDVKDGTSGNWAVNTFEVSKSDADFHNLRASFQPGVRHISPGKYKALTRSGSVIMSNTPAEISDHSKFIYTAKRSGGHILINGLGLGVALKAILESEKVERVTIVELSKDVIDLVADNYLKDSRVEIINQNAFDYKPPKGIRYTCVWHDIWDNICGDNLPEMTKLHRKYGRLTDYQDSWCKDLCKRLR